VAGIFLAWDNPLLTEDGFSEIDQDFAQDHALRVCGLAYTNDNTAARVNAFGLLLFCGYFPPSTGVILSTWLQRLTKDRRALSYVWAASKGGGGYVDRVQ
jgi:hypothetical protein